MISNAFRGLLPYKQFILWKGVPKANGKLDKIPINPFTFEVVSAHDPSAWVDYDTASALAGGAFGVGFVFTRDDPFFFFDLDGCLSDDGQWTSAALGFCGMFAGAAIEVSQSGKGLHIIGTAAQQPEHACKNLPLGIELYTSDRFVALTETSAIGDVSLDMTEPLQRLVDEYFPITVASVVNWRSTPVDEWNGPTDDDLLIEKMLQMPASARATFGNAATIADLWHRNVPVLSQAYPAIGEGEFDGSSADAALASHLAFWTGKNHERIERLMNRSALKRPKWDRSNHKSYIVSTISNAVNSCKNVYRATMTSGTVLAATPGTVPAATMTSGVQFMSPQSMMTYFEGCVYVQDRHQIFNTRGELLTPAQFRAVYGGYEFSMDAENRKTTRNAWEAFTECQAVRFPKVTSMCFRPESPPGQIIFEEGQTRLNSYVPIETPRMQGDASPFLDYLKRLLPDDRDREILLSYMAACVQYPGVKFQWCPLLQGTEGNGKSIIMRVLAFSIGNRYTHLPNAKDLGEGGQKYNKWIEGKLFIGVEEIFVSDRREVTEALKVLITNDRIEIQGKGADQVTGDNRANFVMCSNHQDALQVRIDGRRYSIFYTAQQSESDLKRDGMTEAYFVGLYRWLKTANGYAIMNDFLRTYRIAAQFNPAGDCQRAPKTTSTARAIELSRGTIEQEVLEACDEGRPGFAQGWVSSDALRRLLVGLKAERQIPPAKRRALMQSIGFDYHPGLTDGRTNVIVPAEGTKPRLFIRHGHLTTDMTDPAAIVRVYMKAQNYATFEQSPAPRTSPQSGGD